MFRLSAAYLFTVTGDMLYASAANTPARLAAGAAATVLKMGASIPEWGTSLALTGKITNGNPMCQAYATGADLLAIVTGVTTVLEFRTERYDTDGMHDIVTNVGRITPQTPGVYSVSLYVAYGVSTTGIRITSIRGNGSNLCSVTDDSAEATQQSRATLHWQFKMNGTTDYFDFTVYQESGGNLTMAAAEVACAYLGNG